MPFEPGMLVFARARAGISTSVQVAWRNRALGSGEAWGSLAWGWASSQASRSVVFALEKVGELSTFLSKPVEEGLMQLSRPASPFGIWAHAGAHSSAATRGDRHRRGALASELSGQREDGSV